MNDYKKRLKLRHYAKSGVDLVLKKQKKKFFMTLVLFMPNCHLL